MVVARMLEYEVSDELGTSSYLTSCPFHEELKEHSDLVNLVLRIFLLDHVLLHQRE